VSGHFVINRDAHGAAQRRILMMTVMTNRLRSLIVARQNLLSVRHAARTAAIAVVSFLVAQLFRLPETYWAAITTLIVVQSPEAAMPISAQYFAGTAVGAAVGGLARAYFPANVLVFGLCVLVIGISFAPFRVERSAYRYACITLAIVLLPHSQNGCRAPALSRCFRANCDRPGDQRALARTHVAASPHFSQEFGGQWRTHSCEMPLSFQRRNLNQTFCSSYVLRRL
jgi:hypothetical protein